MVVHQISAETVPDFIRRQSGGVAHTYNIGNRFGWGTKEAYKQLIALEKQGLVRRVGADIIDHGKAQFWEAVSSINAE